MSDLVGKYFLRGDQVLQAITYVDQPALLVEEWDTKYRYLVMIDSTVFRSLDRLEIVDKANK